MSRAAIPWYFRLEVRQSVPILVGLAGILVLLLSLGYFQARQQLLITTRAQVSLAVASIARHHAYTLGWLERAMEPVEKLAATFPHLDEAGQKAADEQMVSMISDGRGRQIVEIYHLDDGGGVRLRRYGSEGLLDTRPVSSGPWTAAAIAAVEAPVWHQPEIDDTRNINLHYTVPLSHGAGGPTIGVGSVQLTVDWFVERVRSFNSFDDEIAFFLSPDGRWTMPPEADAPLSRFKERVLDGGINETGVRWNGESYVAVVMPLVDSGLQIGLLIPRASLFGALDRLTRLLGGIGVGVLLLAAYSLHRTTTTVLRPLEPLARLATRLAQGDLEPDPDAPAPHEPHRFPNEAERLGETTEKLRRALHQRLRDLILLGRTRERLFGELNFARTMQEAQRPQNLPPTDGLEIAAYVHTAGEVCGDIYDYFLAGPRRLCCVMGNAAERGVPAALLSGRVVPLLHELLLAGFPPGKALENVNRMLTAATVGKPALVSVFAGILDLDSGLLRWACAGQLPPFHRFGDDVAQLAWTGNVPLGIREREVYAEQVIGLSPGDLLLFCGPRLLSVPDAAGRSFGDAAMRCFLAGHPDTPPAALLSTLYARLREHAGGPPRDDLTFFAVRWQMAGQTSAGKVVSCPG